MKKKSLTKFLVLLSALIMAFSLTACFEEWLEEDSYSYNDSVEVAAYDSGSKSGFGVDAFTHALDFEPITPSFWNNDQRVDMIEINQALSWGFNADNGEYYLMENFVAGKETAVFVTFDQNMDWNQEHVYLAIERNGTVIAEFTPHIVDDSTLLFLPKNMADADNWQEGAYTFRVFIGDSEAAGRAVNFYETKPMTILMVPIRGNYSGRTKTPDDSWKNSASYTLATYPLARDGFNVKLGPEIDLTDRMYDLDDDDGTYEAALALSRLQTPGKDYDMIIGVAADNFCNDSYVGLAYLDLAVCLVNINDPELPATLAHEIAHIYNIGDEYEGGHLNESLNPAPYGMSGIDIYTYRDVVASKPHVIGGESRNLIGTGSIIYADQRAFWVEQRQNMGATTSYMGIGEGNIHDLWTTSDIWNHLFTVFAGVSGKGQGSAVTGGGGNTGGTDTGWDNDSAYEDSDGFSSVDYYGQCPECYSDFYDLELYVTCPDCWEWTWLDEYDYNCEECGEKNTAYDDDLHIWCGSCDYLIPYETYLNHNTCYKPVGRETSTTINAIDITGTLSQDSKFTATPWYTYEATSSDITSKRSGDYGIFFLDGSGNTLHTAYFDTPRGLRTTAVDGRTSISSNAPLPVDVTVRFPENTAQIVIKKGDAEVYAVDVSKTAPQVAFTGLTDYQQLGDRITLTWEASGEKDDLFFEIWYSPSEDEFYNIASNITGRSLAVDLSAYPGTEEGYFYIYATDGTRTGEAYSEWVKVPYKTPEILTGAPADTEFKITEEILLDVDIYDMQDGWLWDSEVCWMLDGKEFMTGSYLWVWPYELTPGTHTFTCIATNSAGLSVEKDFTFTILDDESDLPNDWSRNDIVNALSNGFAVLLNRIDAPITRGQYAVLMSTLFGSFSESDDPYPDYEEDIVTDCGQDDYDQFLLGEQSAWLETAAGGFHDAQFYHQELVIIILPAVSDDVLFIVRIGVIQFRETAEKRTHQNGILQIGRAHV
jgi:hypothetical protein